jgi:hypothetical protein
MSELCLKDFPGKQNIADSRIMRTTHNNVPYTLSYEECVRLYSGDEIGNVVLRDMKPIIGNLK